METLKTGRFYGQTNQTLHLDFATITDTEYTHDKVDWHYHENAYFTFILDGKVTEGNKKEVYNCNAGSLLFHNWQDPHYNIKPKGYTRGFHIELHEQWFNSLDLYRDNLQGSFAVNNPQIRLLFYKLFKETKTNDNLTPLAAQALTLQVLVKMQGDKENAALSAPPWVKQIKEIINDDVACKFSLAGLSALVNVHPVHLSRDFSKYFNCNLGEYIRALRVAKAFTLIPDKRLSLTEIAMACGFADQSHFLRCFKNYGQQNPTVYRNLFNAC
ncbi:AraC family transcriptional regulator [Mucilaginibacter sp. RB4R14]|uniref:helix-turn-helix domain-containing protein n=1 Tax=Mucilaginibacter aurantiaciroseus TaxID=2949308 RepID=UPI002091DC99|nr:AraC family transcriptional regulator [Mucilaginibacter aurantiaciroseus]MCO5934436.1 AraC family transcriptional regulator [Mucilaginibacter aurantiaciroseus]